MIIQFTFSSKLIRILSLLILSAGVMNSAAYANSAFLKDGVERFDSGDIKGAIIQFENAVRDNPDDMHARLLLCEALLKAERYSRAEIMLNVITKKAPSTRASFRKAEAIFRQGRVKDARQVFKSDAKILGLDANWQGAIEAFENLLTAEEALGEKKSQFAIKTAKKVIDAQDEHFTHDAQLLIARSWFQLGNLRNAQIALDFEPQRVSTRFLATLMRGRIALNSGDIQTAARIGEGLSTEFEGNPEVHSFVVEALIRQGKYKEARAEAKKIVPVSSTDRRADFLTFLSYVAEGDLKSASNISLGAGAWLQSFRQGSQLLAQVKFETEQYDEAERILRAHILRFPSDFEARALLIRAALAQDEHDYAQRLIDESLIMNKDSVPVLFAKVEKLLLDKDYSAAAELATRALKARGGRSIEKTEGNSRPENLSRFAVATVGVSGALRLGRTQEAAEVARQLIEEEPDNPLAHNLLAGVYVNLNKLDLAEKSLIKALELDPTLTPALINYATLETRRGKPDALKIRLEAAIEDGAQDVAIFGALAEQLAADGDEAGAAAVAQKGFALHPQSSDLGLRLAQLNAELGKTEAAIAVAQQFTQSDDVNLIADGAAIYLRLGESERATEVLTQLRAKGRGTDSAGDALLQLYLSEQKYARACSLIKQMRVNKPTDSALLNLLVTCSIELAKFDAAADAAAQAADIDGAVGAFLRARILIAQGKRQEAHKILDAEMARQPTSYLARRAYLLARETNASEEEVQKAFTTLKQWSKANPEDVKSLQLIGYTYLENKEYKVADEVLTAALAGAQTDAELLNNLAWARYESGRPGAVNFAARAYAIEPDNADYIDSLGYFLTKAGEKDRGIELLREAVTRSGGRADIVARLAEAEK